MKAFTILSFISLLLLIEAQLQKKKSEGLSDCVLLNLCDCKEKGVEKLNECYKKLDKEIQSWLMDCGNECGLETTFTSLELEPNGKLVCSQPKDVINKCFDECKEKSKEYMTSVYSDPTKEAVMQSISQAQSCFQVTIGECRSFPGTCI